jgi:hypothetical protein
MGYRKKAEFDQPTAEDFEDTRRNWIWIFPLLALQQATLIFREDGRSFTAYLGIAVFSMVVLTLIAILSGWGARWMSKRDNAILNDEWHRAVSGDASRWGLAATSLMGVGFVIADRWVALDAGETAWVMVNAGMLTAGLRYAWLNRGDPDDDE